MHDPLHSSSSTHIPCCILTITPHATGEALLQATVLATVPVMLRYLAVHRAPALVSQLLADGPLEESLENKGNCIRKVVEYSQ